MLRGTIRLNQIRESHLNLHQLCLGLTTLCPRGGHRPPLRPHLGRRGGLLGPVSVTNPDRNSPL